MSDIAIRVENLGKMYRIGGPQERYTTFRDAISRTVTAPFRRAGDLLRGQAYGAAGLKEEIWALKDISFEVKQGEVVGIIGRNGAGKSTLLKVLSRITEPTEGYADIYGRVGALLEVGTGFHPELTGRENVYLNGAILGMSRNDIERKFDEIVEFAGVEKFIDTPVKYYSSGMGLRLGFAVAAHLEPDILVVDEVLAVGDAEFQKKCLGKMSDVASEGRTVLFVSHNMAAMQNLCSRALLLNGGRIEVAGGVDTIIAYYLRSTTNIGGAISLNNYSNRNSQPFQLTELLLLNSGNQLTGSVKIGEEIRFEVHYKLKEDTQLNKLLISLRIDDNLGRKLFTLSNLFQEQGFDLNKSGQLICHVPTLPLTAGDYRIFIWYGTYKTTYGIIENAMQFSVIESDYFGTGRIPESFKHGSLIVDHQWNFEYNE